MIQLDRRVSHPRGVACPGFWMVVLPVILLPLGMGHAAAQETAAGPGSGDAGAAPGSSVGAAETADASNQAGNSVAAVRSEATSRPAATRPASTPRPRSEARVDPRADARSRAESEQKGEARTGAQRGDGPKTDAKEEKKGYEPRGPTLLTGALGFSYGLTDDSVGGFEMAFTYGYRLTDWIWFDAQANFSFGSDCKEILESGVPKGSRCGSVHGFGINLLAGVQWKFYNVWKVPVVPFVRADAGVVFVITNGPYDGAAFVVRGGGGARYHFTPWFSVGGEVAFVVGPVVRNDMPTNFFAAVDVLAGAEFTF